MSELFADIIAVVGQAELPAVPDAAALTVRVSAEAGTAADAHAHTARVARSVDVRLDELGAVVRRRQTSAVSLAPVIEWGEHGRSRRVAFTAVRDTTLEITDAAAIGPLLADLAAHDEVVVHGPTWLIDADNPVHAQVRALAATDARARAQDYARALGVTLGPVAWGAEPGLRGGGEQRVGRRSMLMSQSLERGGPVEMSVVAGENLVQAAVEVGFRLRP